MIIGMMTEPASCVARMGVREMIPLSAVLGMEKFLVSGRLLWFQFLLGLSGASEKVPERALDSVCIGVHSKREKVCLEKPPNRCD